MSYCRFGSDNGKSDVYVFAHVSGGITVMVAEARLVNGEPVAVGLPYDGKIFSEPTPYSAIIKLAEIGDLGYHVPYKVFARLATEMIDK